MNKKLTALIVVSLVIGQFNLALADCSGPVTLLNEGDKSPCTGYLFTKDKEKEVRLMNEDYNFLKSEGELKDKQINIYKTQINDLQVAVDTSEKKSQLWQSKAEDMTAKFTSAENNRLTRDLLFLAGGIVLTVLGGLAVGATAGAIK